MEDFRKASFFSLPSPWDERRWKLEILRRAADRVCSLILISDFPAIDVRIEAEKVKSLCAAWFPDRIWLYEIVYEARSRRLFEQFRREEEDMIPGSGPGMARGGR